MNAAEPIPFSLLCQHAIDSCQVNGLQPVAFHWGADTLSAFEEYLQTIPMIHDPKLKPLPVGVVCTFMNLPVYRMKASGVACTGRRSYPLGIFHKPKD